MESIESRLTVDPSTLKSFQRPEERKDGDKYGAFLKGLEKILSNDNIEQKSRLIFENIKGMVQIQVFNELMKNGAIFTQIDDRFISPEEVKYVCNAENINALQELCDEMIVRAISIDGIGRGELIELAKAFNLVMQEHQHESQMVKDMMGLPRR
jgi:hypothetical protein